MEIMLSILVLLNQDMALPPQPPKFGGRRVKSPPVLGDLGGIILAVEVND